MVYLAFFRGINVGKNRIKMEDLRSIFDEKSFSNVRSYIQSGNILFNSELSLNVIIELLEKRFFEKFGFSSWIVLRTKEELENCLKNVPFTKEEIKKTELTCVGECTYVTLLKEEPSQEEFDNWKKVKRFNEEFKLVGKDLYFLFETSIRDSKLANTVTKLEKSATTRNLNTITKMLELAKEMEEV